jgi:hypothetical protein
MRVVPVSAPRSTLVAALALATMRAGTAFTMRLPIAPRAAPDAAACTVRPSLRAMN